MSDDKTIAAMLEFDPLHEAGKLTGKSYKDDAFTESLGFVMHLDHVQRKNAALESADDTTFSNTLLNYLRITSAEGFRVVLEVPFKGSALDDGSQHEERLFVLWHPDGILLEFDTFGGDRVNGGKFKYNWRPNNINDGHDALESGGYRKHGDELIWVGYHDCREALRFHLRQLRAKGSFLNPWIERPWLWLLTYMEEKTDAGNHKAITASRVAMLPEEVRAAITPTVVA